MNDNSTRTFLARMGVVIGMVTKNNGWIDGPCPFAPWTHKSGRDRHPSFGIKVNDEGYSGYKCLSCKHHGTLPSLAFKLARFRDEPGLVDLGREIERHELTENEEFLTEWRDDEDDEETEGTKDQGINEGAAFRRYPFAWWIAPARRYLRYRGISIRTATKLNLRWDKRDKRVLFPVTGKSGCIVGFTGRAIGKRTNPRVKDYFGLRKRNYLLGGYNAGDRSQHDGRSNFRESYGHPTHGGTIVVEGLFDYANACEQRIRNVVALLGSELTYEKAQLIEEYDMPIYWFLDNDDAGEQFLWGKLDEHGEHEYDTGALHRFYGILPQFLVEYPEGRNDPGELTQEEWLHMYATAELYIR